MFFVESGKLLAVRRIDSLRDRKLRGMGGTGKKTMQTLINAQCFTVRFQYPIIFLVVNCMTNTQGRGIPKMLLLQNIQFYFGGKTLISFSFKKIYYRREGNI